MASERASFGERATALVLAPAMVVVLIVLASIGVDLASIAGAQRGVERVVAAAVDDAAGMIDTRAHQLDGSVRIDRAAADQVVRARLDTARLPGRILDVRIEVTDTTVDASVRVETPHVFLRAVPGMADRVLSAPIHVRARLRA